MKRRILSLLMVVCMLTTMLTPVAGTFATSETNNTGSLSGVSTLSTTEDEASVPAAAAEKTDWAALAAEVELTGNWRDDLIAIAESQLGYHEENGVSLYGEWAERPTADWTAHFINWVATQAGLTKKQFPHGNTYKYLRIEMNDVGALKRVSRYNYPSYGDLALIEADGQQLVGIVAFISNGYASVIHGDDNGAVTQKSYKVETAEFDYYVDLNVLMERAGIDTGKGGSVPVIPANGVVAWTNTNAVYVRQQPTTQSQRITTVKKSGTPVTVTSAQMCDDGYIWYGIEYEGKVGYIRGDLLTLDKQAIPTATPKPTKAPSNGNNTKPTAAPTAAPEAEQPVVTTAPAAPTLVPSMGGVVTQDRVVNIDVVAAEDGETVNITFDIYGATAYQWYEVKTVAGTDGDTVTTTPIEGATTETLAVVAKAETGVTYSYYCVATIEANGQQTQVTSKTTVLNVGAPIHAVAILGEEINFSFTYENENVAGYQWYVIPVGQTADQQVSGDAFTGADTYKLTFAATAEYAGAQFYCVAKSSSGEHLKKSSVYTYEINTAYGDLTYDELSAYVHELAHMSPKARYNAINTTWAEAGLGAAVVSFYHANFADVYPELLCDCDAGLTTKPGDAHDAACSWYIYEAPADSSDSLGLEIFYDCDTFAEECEIINNWIARQAQPKDIYRTLMDLLANPGVTADGVEYDRYFATLMHVAAHEKATELLCSCGAFVSDYILVSPGTGHEESCPWYSNVTIVPEVSQETTPVDPAKYEQYVSNVDVDLTKLNGEAYVLPEGGRAVLDAKLSGVAGVWQIFTGAEWATMPGETTPAIAVTTSKLATAFAANGEAALRFYDAETDTVYASVTVKAGEAPVAETKAAAVVTKAVQQQAKDETEQANYSIVINYVFEDNTIAADPYTATLAAGSSFSTTVPHPKIVGYLPYVGTATATPTEITISVTNITEDVTYTVTYKPTNVDYTVIHYQQNVDNDNYTIVATETKQGLTKSTVPEVANEYAGFYPLLYAKPEIAADGSTLVEVYYDRYYYLMLFELDGGYGVEPIYARYGATIGEVGTPKKAGYSFLGWSTADDDTVETGIPATTMPAGNVTYYAVWKMADTATVKVVIWGENPNDEEYSYLTTGELMLTPNTEYTYNGTDQLYLYCEKEEHTHTTECGLVCGKEEHTQHTDACLTCNVVSHTHGIDCWDKDVYGAAFSFSITSEHYVKGTETSGSIGESYLNVFGNEQATGNKYIYIAGTWYKYTGDAAVGSTVNPTCGKQEVTHEHSDSCYGCEVHSHTDACYGCGKEEHTHTTTGANPCTGTVDGLDSKLWTFVKSDTKTVNPDGSTVINVYYDRVSYSVQFYSGIDCRDSDEYTSIRITAKWGQNIVDKWPTYNGSSSWYVPDKNDTWQNGIQVMPVGGAKFWGPKTGNSSYTAYYYVEALPGATDTIEHNGVNYVLHHTDTSSSSGRVTIEEQYAIEGFTYKEGTSIGSSYSNAKFYYTRHRYAIEFYSPTTLLKTESGVPYQSPLSSYAWTPDASMAPIQYEPGSVVFEGWYLNPECTGNKFDFTTHSMPAGDNDGETTLVLYAKWVPVTHTVEFFKTVDEYNNGEGVSSITDTHPTLTVPHGTKVADPVPAPVNGEYVFVGWFYEENGEEKAFDFANMPVTKDLKVYAKWSSNKLMEYTVYFMIQGTETEIADPITGSALAGNTKTFDAKGDEELYAGYQEGYFPIVKSHSMTIDIEDPTKNTYTFYYVQKDAVPYTVYYVAETLKEGEDASTYATIVRDGKTYYIIADTYTNSENRKAVVTERFEVVSGYMPDAYQKRLVVDGSDRAVNEIIFFYTVDSVHAIYTITHYTQNTDGETWTVYASSEATGIIGDPYTAEPLTIDGFTHEVIENLTVASGVLTENGLELKLYYVRNSYPYEVRYLEYGTGTVLATTKKGSGLYGDVVSESAIEIVGYTAMDPTSATLVIKIEKSQDVAELNIITFYYEEKEVTINYVPVGPEGLDADGKPLATAAGTVTLAAETIKVLTDDAQGSEAKPNVPTYKFVGWYSDAACTQAVPADWVDGNNRIVPQKTDADSDPDTAVVHVAATYYAKFDWYVGSLEITKTVENNTGFTPAVDKFTFTVDFELPAGATLPENGYSLTVVDETGKEVTEDVPTTIADGGTFVLKHEWQATIGGLLHGTTYTVTEEAEIGYTTEGTGTTGTIEAGATKTAAFTNTYAVGALTISKEVIGETAPADATFEFTVTLPAGTFTYTQGDESKNIVNGGKVTLKHNESITINGIPAGTDYAVAETVDESLYTMKAENANGKIVANEAAAVKFTNTYLTGSLTVTKTVVNNTIYDVSDQEFTFAVKLTHDKAGLLPATISYKVGEAVRTAPVANGVYTITLKGGESAVFTGLPYGTNYAVVETPVAGYEMAKANDTGVINADHTENTAVFTNTYKVGTLTIKKTVANTSNAKDTFLFRVTGNGVNLQVLVPAGGFVTIEHLPVGEYTVTEIESWSWRYDCTDADATMTATITLEDLTAEVTFTNEVIHDYWLDGSDSTMNQFTVTE